MQDANTKRLFELIEERAFVRGEVKLASGATSDFYIDGRMVAVSPESAHLIGEVFYDRVKDLEFDSVGGMAVGAVPLTASFVISCHTHGRDVEGFWVRAETKEHGMQKKIEGKFPENANVVILEDVVTSGGSSLKAIDAIEAAGGRIVAILALVDREAGARELFAERGYKYDPIFTKQDFFANAES